MNRLIQLRGGFYLLLLMAICATPFALAQRNAAKQSTAKHRSGEQRIGEIGNALPATTIVVTNTNDTGPGSLRNALAIANDGDTIDATGVSGTILLTSGELQITHNVTINGPGADSLAINGNATDRVFENFATNVTISGLTITNGHGGILNHGGLTLSNSTISGNGADGSGGGINSGDNNGGATLTVTNSTISDNSVSVGDGGGIYSYGTLAVTNSSISGNSIIVGPYGKGGGIRASGTVTISNSTINGNQNVGCYGGGLWVYGDVTVISSTISGNSMVGAGGGEGCSYPWGGGGIALAGAGTIEIIDSTISGNHADRSIDAGGGIYMIDMCPGSVTVTNSTVSDNSSASGAGGGGFAYECPDGGTPGTFVIENSTFSGNWAPNGGSIRNDGGVAQIGDTVLNAGASGGTILNYNVFTSLGYNLASDNGGGVLTGPGDQINTDPMLGPLLDNGGPTFTHALLPGSPAINTGDPTFTPPPLFDQRGPGFDRVVNGHIDKGSFEVQEGGTPTPTPTSTPTPTPRAQPTPRSRPTPAPRP